MENRHHSKLSKRNRQQLIRKSVNELSFGWVDLSCETLAYPNNSIGYQSTYIPHRVTSAVYKFGTEVTWIHMSTSTLDMTESNNHFLLRHT